MFYRREDVAYRILGVYRVTRHAQTLVERHRSHSALSLRIRGKSVFTTKDQSVRADDGSVLYLPAGLDYTRHTRADEEMIVIHLAAYGEREKELVYLRASVAVTDLFVRIADAWAARESESYLYCMSLFYQLLGELSRDAHTKDAAPDAVTSAYAYMKAHFCDKDLRIATLAALAHVSEPYLRRLWQSHFGISPHEALLNMRFGYAEQLLATAYYEIKEVADRSGFSDVKYFRVAFQKRYGCSPSAYAKGVLDQPLSDKIV